MNWTWNQFWAVYRAMPRENQARVLGYLSLAEHLKRLDRDDQYEVLRHAPDPIIRDNLRLKAVDLHTIDRLVAEGLFKYR